MIQFIVVSIFTTPGFVFILNMRSIENIIWDHLNMEKFKRPIRQFLNPLYLLAVMFYGYAWILSGTVRRDTIRSILEQTREKMAGDFETHSRLRDVGLILYDKFG